jgi:hypothetical protein
MPAWVSLPGPINEERGWIVADEQQPRLFNLEQANQALPIIRPLVKQILAVRQAILERQPEIWPVLEKAAGNGGNKVASQVEREFERLDALVRRVQATGALLKDVNTGLVDFLSMHEGREVYLCWQYDEDQVSYWHDLDAGFTGRQPIG